MSGAHATTLAYGPEPEQVADLRVPPGPPRGLVVLLHGGYWREGYRRDLMDLMADALTAHGLATWNVEYRRVGCGGGIPETLDDVAAAIDHAGRLSASRPHGFGPVVIVGHSAGGHLALCAAGRHRHRGAPELAIGAVVSLGGVCDLEAAARMRLSNDAAVSFAGGTVEARPWAYAEASPPHLLPLGIPYLLLHGQADASVPSRLSEDFHSQALAAGDHGDLLLLEGVGHFEPIDPATPAFSRLLQWVDTVLRDLAQDSPGDPAR